jgi:hypothetical protein
MQYEYFGLTKIHKIQCILGARKTMGEDSEDQLEAPSQKAMSGKRCGH